MKINTNFSQEFKEYRIDDASIFLFGALFVKDVFLSDKLLADFLVKNIKENTLSEIKLNGFFSFCYRDNYNVIIGVDHLRTKAIFYTIENNIISLSDSAKNILNICSKSRLDISALDEFKATGYVFGDKTIYKDVKYTKGGTITSINLKDSGTISQIELFSFKHKRREHTFSDILITYDNVIDTAFDRFIKYANGRQIIVPLSAGHDSLMVVSALKKKGYTNVLTFTYGKKDNKEALRSKEVAEKLGFKWIFVEYTKDKWLKEWSESDILKDFTSYTMNLHCLPHIQDYIAVKEMKELGVLDDNAVFAPGHCVTGVSFPKFNFYTPNPTKKQLVDFIFNHHFVNDKSVVNKNEIQFKEYISQFCDNNNFLGTASSFADIVELWQWLEREPKYIVNSVRNYTFFGYDYWIPLWDIEHVNFWKEQSFTVSGDRKWFEWYIQNYYKKLIGDSQVLEFIPMNKYPKEFLFKSTLFAKLIKRVLYFIVTKGHPLLFDEIYSRGGYFKEIVIKGNHLLNGYAKKFLKIIFK